MFLDVPEAAPQIGHPFMGGWDVLSMMAHSLPTILCSSAETIRANPASLTPIMEPAGIKSNPIYYPGSKFVEQVGWESQLV